MRVVWALSETIETLCLIMRLIRVDLPTLGRPTDVLSFALNEGEEDGYEGPDTALLGDIIISLEKVQEQADEYGHSFERELAYLTIHGMLHILGYDHMEPEDKAEMRKEEEFILQRLDYVRQGEEL